MRSEDVIEFLGDMREESPPKNIFTKFHSKD